MENEFLRSQALQTGWRGGPGDCGSESWGESLDHDVKTGPLQGSCWGALVPIQALLACILSDLPGGCERIKPGGQHQHLCQAAPDANCMCVCRGREVGDLPFAF